MCLQDFFPKRKFLIIFCTISILAVVFSILIVSFIVFYYWAVQPIVAMFYIDATDIHKGTEYFETGEYTEFESGAEFQSLLSSTEFFSADHIADFYHIDNRSRDNPIYGKMCDVFALDVQLEDAQYTALCSRDDLISCSSIQDYRLFLLPDYETSSQEDTALIAVNDVDKTVRIILLTDYERQFLSDYATVLLQQSSLNWQARNKTGDGLRKP